MKRKRVNSGTVQSKDSPKRKKRKFETDSGEQMYSLLVEVVKNDKIRDIVKKQLPPSSKEKKPIFINVPSRKDLKEQRLEERRAREIRNCQDAIDSFMQPEVKDCSPDDDVDCDCRCHHWGGSGCHGCFSVEIYDVDSLRSAFSDALGDEVSFPTIFSLFASNVCELYSIEPEIQDEGQVMGDDYATEKEIREGVLQILSDLDGCVADWGDRLEKKRFEKDLQCIEDVIGDEEYENTMVESIEWLKSH